jgi:hypothetical protein
MADLDIRPLREDLSFGVRVGGVTLELLRDAAQRKTIADLFETHGMIVF